MLTFIILASILVLIIAGLIVNLHEKKYKQDLLTKVSYEKFQKMNVCKLELKRFVKYSYLGSSLRLSPNNLKRKEISLNSPLKDKIGFFNTLENELTVFALVGNYSHEVYTCPYSEENKKTLLHIIEEYSKLQQKK